MNAQILCTLLAQRIPPEQFQLWGLEVHWMDKAYNTIENQAIVADVIANYDTLVADYQAEQEKAKQDAETKAKLAEIDLKSIRPIREYLAAKPDAPEYLKTYEAQAIAERAVITK